MRYFEKGYEESSKYFSRRKVNNSNESTSNKFVWAHGHLSWSFIVPHLQKYTNKHQVDLQSLHVLEVLKPGNSCTKII